MAKGIRPVDRLESIVERLDGALEERDVDTELTSSGILSGVDVDVIDEREEVVVLADLPGFEKDGISVRGDDHRLRVSAEASERTKQEEKTYYKRERKRQKLDRTVTLPVEVEVGNAEASYDDGVLSVRLPKAETAEGKEIEIE